MWTADEVVSFVFDCHRHGVRAVSFGGGEPLLHDGLFDILCRLRGVLFRSVTTNGLPLVDRQILDGLIEVQPDKVHLSLHRPNDLEEVRRVIDQVRELGVRGIRSGLNFLVARSTVDEAIEAAELIHRAGIGNDRITFLPMRGHDTPSPEDIGKVAGGPKFQATSCLLTCGLSRRFCSIACDRTVSWCSYTSARRPIKSLTMDGLLAALKGMDVIPCAETLPVVPLTHLRLDEETRYNGSLTHD
jgi:hypothetical protein